MSRAGMATSASRGPPASPRGINVQKVSAALATEPSDRGATSLTTASATAVSSTSSLRREALANVCSTSSSCWRDSRSWVAAWPNQLLMKACRSILAWFRRSFS